MTEHGPVSIQDFQQLECVLSVFNSPSQCLADCLSAVTPWLYQCIRISPSASSAQVSVQKGNGPQEFLPWDTT